MGNSTTMQIGIVSRFWFCRWLRRFEIIIGWTPIYFRKSNICANKSDMQETDISLAQLNRSWNNFSGGRFTHGRNSRAWSKYFILHQTKSTNPKVRVKGNLSRNTTLHILADMLIKGNFTRLVEQSSSFCSSSAISDLFATETNINTDDFLDGYVTLQSACLDWRGTRSVRQKLFRNVKKDDQIAPARFFSTSGRRRSSRIQNLGTDASFRIYVFSALGSSSMTELLAERRRTWEEIPEMCGSIPCWCHPIPSSNSRPLWRKTHYSDTARQRVVAGQLRRAHLPRWKLSNDTHPIIQSGLIPRDTDVKQGRHAVKITAVNPMRIVHYRDMDYDETKFRIAGILTLMNCSSIKRYPLQHFTSDVYREGDGQEVRRRIVQ